MPEGSLLVTVSGRGSAGNHGLVRINVMTTKIHGPFHPGTDYTMRSTAFVQFGQLDKPRAVKSAKSYQDSQRK